ncbi:MAG: hypothetical protein LBQ28_05095 [Prevotellaceae bacterium]|jgi:hypothetical protein|nr:hypothetical protein [Prevotellaceae bacterium]
MKQSIWLSYDLGIKGDYSGLYQWLDSLNALECGNNVAFFKITINKDENLIEKLKSEICQNIEIKNGERFYVVYKKEDGKYAGKYIFGNRKANPWEGYKQTPSSEDI